MITLVTLVANNAHDVEIWSDVFDLVARTGLKQAIPPIVFGKSVFDAPMRFSLPSEDLVEQTHDEATTEFLTSS